MKPLNSTLAATGTTIFETMSGLARTHAAVNLGQGFPDTPGPIALRDAAAEHVRHGLSQYPPMMGLPELRQAVATRTWRSYNIFVDGERDVLVTSGATEALLDCFLALINPGDEVVILEPAYDTYAPALRLLGAVVKPVRLVPPDWALPLEELAAAFSERTKLLVLNSPMNPCGKVFSEDELAVLARLVVKHDAYAVCDEVYEHLIFDGARHIPLMTFPGMRERCMRIGSAGKTFSLTGWKVGYVTAPPNLMPAIAKAHQLVTFSTPPNLQHAVALGLLLDDDYFSGLTRDLARSRERLASGLTRLGIPVLPSAGTYFLVADMAAWMAPDENDEAFAERLVVAAGVVTIPLSAFYQDHAPRTLVRFCFCKTDATIDAALANLAAWLTGLAATQQQ